MLVKARPVSGPARRGRAGGFTLVELLTTLTIVGVLAAFAMPNLASFIAGQRVKTASYDLFASLMLARSEAIKRNTNVTVTAASGGWANGWSVTAGGETLVSQGPFSSLTVTSSADTLTYSHNGRTTNTGAQNFLVSSTRAAADANRCLSIGLSGMPTTKLGTCS